MTQGAVFLDNFNFSKNQLDHYISMRSLKLFLCTNKIGMDK
jgi:hypothetical protein